MAHHPPGQPMQSMAHDYDAIREHPGSYGMGGINGMGGPHGIYGMGGTRTAAGAPRSGEATR